eukprot:m.277675 g.277675  ORF g.277675 m.277675 type:complete len:128 (+) comp26935_c0_seq15:663-1046(+)
MSLHCMLSFDNDDKCVLSHVVARARSPPAYEIDEADGELKIRVEVEGSSPVSMVTVQQAQRHGATVSVYRIPNGPRKVLAAHLVKNPAARYRIALPTLKLQWCGWICGATLTGSRGSLASVGWFNTC